MFFSNIPSRVTAPQVRARVNAAEGRVSCQQQGFTLVEAMVVVALLAIIAAIAAPNFADLIARTRIKSLVSSLEASIYLARSEAIRRGIDLQMSPRNCAGDAPGVKSRWGCGWQIVPAAGGAAIRTVELTGQDVMLRSGGQGRQNFSARGTVSFAGFDVSNRYACRVVDLSIAGRITVSSKTPTSSPDAGTGSYCP